MIRRAVDADIPALDRLLFQVHQVHHEARPDLFKAGAKKYTDAQLKAILADDKTPVFVAERGGAVVGYAFCIHKQFVNDNNMTDIKTLYIDDLCVDERARGGHIGTRLYEYVLDFARQQGYLTLRLRLSALDTVAGEKPVMRLISRTLALAIVPPSSGRGRASWPDRPVTRQLNDRKCNLNRIVNV